MRFKVIMLAAAGLAMTYPAQAAAKNVTAEANIVAQTMQSAGYQTSIEKLSNGLPFIQSGAGGYPFRVFFLGCDSDGKGCKWVQFFAGFRSDKSPTLEQMNAYARENPWGRIYIDEEDDPVIELDVDLEAGGMSPELFADNVAYWQSAMGRFAKFVYENN